jgi:putative FmdB family regulatory protein
VPIYEYRCDACGHVFEVFQKMSDRPVETCEMCGGAVAKVMHPVAIHFKGSGFYTTDYGRSSSRGGEPGGDQGEGAKTTGEASKSAEKSGADGGNGSGSAKKADKVDKADKAAS